MISPYLSSSLASLQEARRPREAGRALQGKLPQEEPEPPEARALGGGWIESTSIFSFFFLFFFGRLKKFIGSTDSSNQTG